MAASITIWTSTTTRLAEAKVAKHVSAAYVCTHAYDSLSLAGCDEAESVKKISDAFHRLVSLTMTDSALHTVAVIPIYEKDSVHQIESLVDACSKVPHKLTLHILGLCKGLSRIFSTEDAEDADKIQKDAIKSLSEACNKVAFGMSYSLIDDFAANGAPIGFTLNSLSRYLALIQTALTGNYYEILSPALLSAHPGENITVGISSLSFDRKAAASRLMGYGFLAALDRVGINKTKVDLQKAAHTAETFLRGISDRYPRLFQNSVQPLYKEKGMEEGQVVAEASKILDDDLEKLHNDILKILKNQAYSFPEKEAIIAMILGRDNENLSGMQYEHEGLLLDDACEHPIDLYVDAFNKWDDAPKLLPLRGDYGLLKLRVWSDEKEEFVESPENKKAFNPLPDIKNIKQDILNSTAFIRSKSADLKSLKDSQDIREDAAEVRRQWRRPEGNLKDIEYKEQPLDEKYVPSPGLKIKDTVDLRAYFPPVRNQQNLGSCSSFATSAMYEAMMYRNGVEGDNVMSPGYLFYYSNVLTGHPSGGSNYFEQLEVLGKHGICYESLFTYNPLNPSVPPSKDAEEDAKIHRVLAAKQIPLVNEADKTKTLQRNHQLLTSALSEGYPVGISLRVYDNLGKDGAFILHPEDAPNAKEDGWHAMVLAGYSEENDFYIVRNSWGEDFGENGYCYIPSAYIDDPHYLNFACIITEITDSSDKKADIPTVLANFGATETEIRMAAIRNAIAKVRIELKNSQNLYKEYYKYYQKLVMQLTMPNVQNAIRKHAETVQCLYFLGMEAKKRELENSFVGKLDEYKKSIWGIIVTLITVTVGFGLWAYLADDSYWQGLVAMCSGILALMTILGYKWWVRIKRRELQEELDEIAVDAKRQSDRWLEMQIKFHVAGMWISRFHRLSVELGKVYDRLVSFNDMLREWQKGYTNQLEEEKRQDGQMFRFVNPGELLVTFFKANKERIVKNIDLLNVFEDYKADIRNLEKSHEQLREIVMDAISSLMEDFNMVNFLLGDEYPYLPQIDLPKEIASLLAVGQPSYPNRVMNATPPLRMIMANVEKGSSTAWDSTISRNFPMRPRQLSMEDTTTLTILTLHPYKD